MKIEFYHDFEEEFDEQKLKEAIAPYVPLIKEAQKHLYEAYTVLPKCTSVNALIRLEGFSYSYKGYSEDLYLMIQPDGVYLVLIAEVSDIPCYRKEMDVGRVVIEEEN